MLRLDTWDDAQVLQQVLSPGLPGARDADEVPGEQQRPREKGGYAEERPAIGVEGIQVWVGEAERAEAIQRFGVEPYSLLDPAPGGETVPEVREAGEGMLQIGEDGVGHTGLFVGMGALRVLGCKWMRRQVVKKKIGERRDGAASGCVGEKGEREADYLYMCFK